MHKYWAKKEPLRAGLFASNMFKVGRVVCGGIKEFSSFSVNIRFLPGRLLESRPNGANLQYKNERIQVKRATQFNTRNCLRQCENGHWTMDDITVKMVDHIVLVNKSRGKTKNSPRDSSVKI